MTPIDFPETQYADSDGLSIAFQVWGTGERNYVLIPGVISHIESELENPDYVKWIASLSEMGRLVIFDKRGNGMSDRIQGAPTDNERMADIAAVMDAAGMASASVIGFSEGATLACVFAVTRPERVERLALCGSYAVGRLPRGDTTEDDLRIHQEQFRQNWGKPGKPHPISVYGPGPEDPEGQEAFARFQRLSCTPNTIAALWELNARLDIRPLLPSIKQPTLVMHREAEGNSGAIAMPFVELIPDVTYRVVPGDHHLPWFGDLDSYVAAIREFFTGETTAPQPAQRRLATVLMTDLVGSTALQARLGDDAWRDLMNRHDRICERQVTRHGGQLVKFTGDGMLAFFDAPTSAVACATQIRDTLTGIDLETRAGAHTGEIELRGDDVSGISVVVAARIMDKAAGGQVLTSDLTRQLMLGAPYDFADTGEHDLKGVPDRWRLYQVSPS